jgi:hypothetical protein
MHLLANRRWLVLLKARLKVAFLVVRNIINAVGRV